jgi:acetyltransferase-like isoleucine patch superfamily enzyme
MRRALYYLIKYTAIISRLLKSKKIYMYLITKAHTANGVVFLGKAKFIHPNAVLDTSMPIYLGEGVVISTGVLILTHDYSITIALNAIGKKPATDIAIVRSVFIEENCFIGANSTILGGTKIRKNSIIGAGSFVKGEFSVDSIIAGNPAKVIMNTKEWILDKDLEGLELYSDKR